MSRKLNALGALPARAVQQWSHIMDRIASGKGLVDVVRRISPQWSANIDTILAHTPGEEADIIMGIAAVALHNAAT